MIADLLDDIADLSCPVAGIRTEGIYCLFFEGKLVYVGQSNSCEVRINTHLCEKLKTFDRYTIIRMDDKPKRLLAEKEMIEVFKPCFNNLEPRHYGFVWLSQVRAACGLAVNDLWQIVTNHKVTYKYKMPNPMVDKAKLIDALELEGHSTASLVEI